MTALGSRCVPLTDYAKAFLSFLCILLSCKTLLLMLQNEFFMLIKTDEVEMQILNSILVQQVLSQ